MAAAYIQPKHVISKVKKFRINYRKSGNFHVEIIHVVNIHVNLVLWVYGTHENILT